MVVMLACHLGHLHTRGVLLLEKTTPQGNTIRYHFGAEYVYLLNKVCYDFFFLGSQQQVIEGPPVSRFSA